MLGYTYENESACTKEAPCISSYDATSGTFTNNKTMTNSTIKDYLESWYTTNLAAYDASIGIESYCNDTSLSSETTSTYNYYGPYDRIKNNQQPILKCPETSQTYGGYYETKIGLLTADEIMLAGYGWDGYASTTNYLYYDKWFWGIFPYFSNESAASVSFGYFGYFHAHYRVTNVGAVRPVNNLKSDTLITLGNGTQANPYVIDIN